MLFAQARFVEQDWAAKFEWRPESRARVFQSAFLRSIADGSIGSASVIAHCTAAPLTCLSFFAIESKPIAP
jgi:hypothetical protein